MRAAMPGILEIASDVLNAGHRRKARTHEARSTDDALERNGALMGKNMAENPPSLSGGGQAASHLRKRKAARLAIFEHVANEDLRCRGCGNRLGHALDQKMRQDAGEEASRAIDQGIGMGDGIASLRIDGRLFEKYRLDADPRITFRKAGDQMLPPDAPPIIKLGLEGQVVFLRYRPDIASDAAQRLEGQDRGIDVAVLGEKAPESMKLPIEPRRQSKSSPAAAMKTSR